MSENRGLSLSGTRDNSLPSWMPERFWTHVGLWIACFIIGLPLLYALLVATQTNAQSARFSLSPGNELLRNINFVFFERELWQFMLNSTLQAIIITVGKTILSLLAGLAFVYFRFPGKWFVFGFVLITLMMPTELMIIALFRIVNSLNWDNSLQGITVPFLASATGAFLFRQHFANLPAELSEASQLDGAGPITFLFRVLIPLSWNAIGALAVIQFVYVWNMYLWPLIILTDADFQTVQIGFNSLRDSDTARQLGSLATGALIATLPPVLVFIALQKQFMSGFAISRDK